jgi:hypothetical protein
MTTTKQPPSWLPDRFAPEFRRFATEVYPAASSQGELELVALSAMHLDLWRDACERLNKAQTDGERIALTALAAAHIDVTKDLNQALQRILSPGGAPRQ